MIKRVYANNFKSLVNTEADFDSLTLLLGKNGSGKSAMVEMIYRVAELLEKQPKLFSVFEKRSLTEWVGSETQSFEIDVVGNGGLYTYKLKIEHEKNGADARIKRERLEYDEKPLFNFEMGEVQLYRDDHSEGPSFTLDWSSSGLASVLEGRDNRKLVWFRNYMKRVILAKQFPARIRGSSETEILRPHPWMQNFVAWYRGMAQGDFETTKSLFDDLSTVIDGFQSANLAVDGGQKRALEVLIKASDSNEPVKLRFDQLSDGERALFVLYALLRFQGSRGGSLVLDEPANYVGLKELRPFLQDVEDQVIETNQFQVILISHHPKIIDFLGSSHGRVFRRDSGGPTRVDKFEGTSEEPFTVSELVEHGELE